MTDPQTLLNASTDAMELQGAAIDLADRRDEAAHAALRSALLSESFRDRLDSPETLIAPPTHLRIGKVLSALMQNRAAPAAHRTLLALTQDADFTRNRARSELLIQALAGVVPSPPEAVDFWDRHCRSLDGYCHLTARAIISNGSPPAIALFERKMRDPAIDVSDKFYWLRAWVVAHRNDVPLLAACDRLVQQGLSDVLRPILIEVLFDYQPERWYILGPKVAPPPRIELTANGRGILLSIGKFARSHVALDSEQRQAVERVLAGLRTQDRPGETGPL